MNHDNHPSRGRELSDTVFSDTAKKGTRPQRRQNGVVAYLSVRKRAEEASTQHLSQQKYWCRVEFSKCAFMPIFFFQTKKDK